MRYCIRVSEGADVSEDEDDCLSEDRYEDSFIDDQGGFTQTPQVDGNNGDMMGFYRYVMISKILSYRGQNSKENNSI